MMPRRPPRELSVVRSTFCTLLQHCMLPVLHWLTDWGIGVATARTARVEKMANFANIVLAVVELCVLDCWSTAVKATTFILSSH